VVLEQFLKFVKRHWELVEGNSGEAFEEFGPRFVPSLIILADYISLPFIMSMFMLAPPIVIASTKSTKA
jgi:hypothetical protein